MYVFGRQADIVFVGKVGTCCYNTYTIVSHLRPDNGLGVSQAV